jgi:methanogenic corrinoid protein MtbC1
MNLRATKIMTSNDSEQLISIGELSKLTGVTTHSLRMWEKRYGTPKAHRLPSGHRRYPKEDVPRLRAIVKALESGYRASKVVTGTLEQLHSLMGLPFFESNGILNSSGEVGYLENEPLIETWIKHVYDYDDDLLITSFHALWGEVGGLNFVIDYAASFLERIGNAWKVDELTISHEHFATECLVGFFTEKWRQLNIRKKGPLVLITTLPGDSYNLGILMCALVTSITNLKVVYLGIGTPINEIIRVAKKDNPKVIALSISHSMSSEFAEDCLFKIRGDLDKNSLIITGGKGSPCNIPGVSYLSNFKKYYKFINSLNC